MEIAKTSIKKLVRATNFQNILQKLQKENIPTLLKQMNWSLEEQPQEKGDMVWILKDLMPRDLSPLGRVIAEYPGRGGTARVMTV